uniref:SWIM-type domain-containing protein n=1 Tax=Kalanchoe fedtschenkoi TaxID=63787 RepID=A0A7N0ZSB2_KALFE
MDLASDGSLKSVFWADGRARSAYSQFGDVLVFDVTYRTNHFRLPFAPFVGVNHHRQSILFGAALLEDETEGTFIWLFEQFLNCMFHKQPLTIITDQDGAMRNAIRKIFCNTRHRLCAWHINKHVIEHLIPIIPYMQILEKVTPTGRRRYYWVKVYLKDCFTTGMTTSGRSESMNSYFDGYVNSNTMLNDFVKQYDKAVESRRNKEADEDFRTLESHAMPLTNYPIEKQVGMLYTRNLFEIFKSEWRKSFDCIHKTNNKGDNFVEYLVVRHSLDVNHWRIVNYLSSGDISIKCSCCKFEMEGILCKHILYIVRKKNLEVIPEKYFLPRWTINARYKGNMSKTLVGSSELIGAPPSPLGMWSVQRKFTIALEACRTSPMDMKLLESLLDNYIDKVGSKRPNERVTNPEEDGSEKDRPSLVFVNDQCRMTVRDPATLAKNKGRPPLMKRMQSGLELAAKAKKQKTCRTCNEKGHNSSGCSQRKAKAVEALSTSNDF